MDQKRIPLMTVTGDDWDSHEHLHKLERYIAKNHTVACNSVQTAIQICCEILGTRTEIIPVIMPVTAPPDTLAAVLRSGAHPLLLDIDETTLQMRADQLEIALEEAKTAIVLLNRPGGAPVDERLQELIADQPSICDARLVSNPSLGVEDLPCVFNVFDLSPLVGSGGVIVHKFTKQVDQLKIVRSGIMGHSGALSEPQAKLALEYLKDRWNHWVEVHQRRCERLVGGLEAHAGCGILPYEPGKWPSPLYLKVPNAKRAVAHLQSYGIEAALGVFPLHRLEEVRIRYREAPEYPYAEKLEQEIICLPTHVGMGGLEVHVTEWLSEICSE